MWPNIPRMRASRLSTRCCVVDIIRFSASCDPARPAPIEPQTARQANAKSAAKVQPADCRTVFASDMLDSGWGYADPESGVRPLKEITAMLIAEGCRRRRERLWQQLDPPTGTDFLLLSDPIHLAYLANYWADPISSGTDFHAYLLV